MSGVPTSGGAPLAAAPVKLSMANIHKSFGDVHANDGVSLAVARQEIHCLLGENGAGKTTLMNVLAGLYTADAGQIVLDGRAVAPRRAKDAIALGIGMVHQHFMLVDRLTVLENLIVGMEPIRRGLLPGLIHREAAIREVRNVSERYGLQVRPQAYVDDLSVGEQQRVEILKVLMRRSDLIVFDEPTAVLSPQEVDELYGVMRRLQTDGKTIIFITHKLKETLRFSDRVTVLRHGRNAGTVITGEATATQLAQMMIGRRPGRRTPRAAVEQGPERLRLDRVSVGEVLQAVDLTVHSGEIVGVAGVEGNGQLELEEVIAGLRRGTGELFLGGHPCGLAGPRRRRRLGLAHIPSDRLRRGLVAAWPVARNAVLGYHMESPFAARGLLQTRAIRRHAGQLARKFDIRGNLDGNAGSLSGGNQQKLVVGRELDADPTVILACQPTRGVDIGAVEQVHARLLAARERGAAILLISADLDELFALSDRLVVLYEGAVVARGAADDFTPTTIGLYMAGRLDEAGTPVAQPREAGADE